MVNLLEQGLSWLNEMRVRHMAASVRYCRESHEIEVSATTAQTVVEVSRDHGLFERIESRDFLISASDLIVDGNPILPSPGDRIREERGGKAHIHEVMDLDGEPCFRWCDPFGITLRIHTKLIGTENL